MIGQKLNEKCHKEMQTTRAEKNYYWQKRQESIANYRKMVGRDFYNRKEQKNE